jgi:uncharacterized protein YggE
MVALTLPSLAQDSPSPTVGTTQRTVTVSGNATIKSAPDEAVVSLGVQTQASTAQAALAQNADKMNAVIAAIVGQGITKADLATEGVSLYPTYGQNGQNVTGYQASNIVDVTVRDMNKVGVIIDTAVGAGANLANGITFKLSDQNQGVNTALAAAVADAQSKAEALASAGNAQLGQVVSIDETTASAPPPIFYGRAMSAGASPAPTPVQPPTLETQVSVTVVWALT